MGLLSAPRVGTTPYKWRVVPTGSQVDLARSLCGRGVQQFECARNSLSKREMFQKGALIHHVCTHRHTPLKEIQH